MKKIFLTLCSCLFLNAGVYYAKIEPFESYIVKAATSGKVVFVDRDQEGIVSDGKVIIELDSYLIKENLKTSKERLKNLEESLILSKVNLQNLESIAKIKEENYQKIKSLSSKSKVEKDNDFISLTNAKNQVVSSRESILSQQTIISDLKYSIKSIEDTIEKMSIDAKDLYVYKIYVNEQDYVNTGTTLLEAYDISKAKLTIFLNKEDVKNIESKTLYIDEQEIKVISTKLWDVADVQNISSYRYEIVFVPNKRFSELVKIEFKD